MLDIGPYAGRSVDWVAVVDAPYLRDLIAEGIGSDAFRAAAAAALARRGRLPETEPARPEGVVKLSDNELEADPGPPTTWAHWFAASNGRAADDGTRGYRTKALLSRPSSWIVLVALLAIFARSWAMRQEPAPPPLAASPVRSAQATSNDSAAAHTGTAPVATAVRAALALRPGREARENDAPSQPEPAGVETPTTDTTPPPCGARIPGAIPAASAADFLDTFQAVEFKVVGTKDTGKVTFLNSHEPYQGHFYVAIFPSDYELYPAHPALHFRDRCIVVQGTIERFRGVPQIVLRGPEDVRVVDEPVAVGGKSTDGRR